MKRPRVAALHFPTFAFLSDALTVAFTTSADVGGVTDATCARKREDGGGNEDQAL